MAGAGKTVTITVCEIALTEMLEPRERIAHLIKTRKGRHTQLYVARKFAARLLDALELGRRLKRQVGWGRAGAWSGRGRVGSW